MMPIVLIILLAPLPIFAIISYNRLIRDKNRVLSAWSDIDVQLARRHELIPKLIAVAKSYGQYEQNTLEQLTRLRTTSRDCTKPEQKSALENQLSNNLKQILVLMENYPTIKTNQQYISLQHNLSDVENTIQSARRYYNGAVRNLNIRIDSFPDLILARLFGYRHAAYFVMEDRS